MSKFKLVCQVEEWTLSCLKNHFPDIVYISEPLCVSGVYQLCIRVDLYVSGNQILEKWKPYQQCLRYKN